MHIVHFTAKADPSAARRLSGSPMDGKERTIIYYKETLTAERAQAIISANFTQFRGVHVAFLDEGWDFQVFEVDANWLFRFPKREESAARLTKEYQLLSGLGEWVSLPVPNYQYFRESHEGSSWPFAGYKKLPGTSADVAEAVDWPSVARQLGLFLAELHAYPVDRAEEAGVPEERDRLAQWRDESLTGLDRVVGLHIDRRDLSNYLESDVPRGFDDILRLVHNDLWAEHVLIDPHTSSVSGIIDWGDAAIGDPAVDFAGVYAWHGEQGLRDVLTHYSGTLEPDIICRARYLATCLAIRNIILGQDLGRAQWVRAGQKALRWAFVT
jgi:aminoglycoside phosphotransferase (APT) family kinase protein